MFKPGDRIYILPGNAGGYVAGVGTATSVEMQWVGANMTLYKHLNKVAEQLCLNA